MSSSKDNMPYFGMTGTNLNIWVTVACTTAMTLFGNLSPESSHRPNILHTIGYDQGVFGGIIVTPSFLEQMGNPGPSLQGTIVSLYEIGWYIHLHVLQIFVFTISSSFSGAMSTFVFGKPCT